MTPNQGVNRVAVITSATPESGGANEFESAFVDLLKKTNDESIELSFYSVSTDKKRFFIRSKSSKNGNILKISTFTKARLAVEMSPVMSSLISRFRFFETKIEKYLTSHANFVVFLSPNPLALILKKIPIGTTVWDLGHRELPELPEFQQHNNFNEREFYYRSSVPRSAVVITDSDETTNNLVQFYGMHRDRAIPVGLLPNLSNFENRLNVRNPINSPYIFYPAQFWAHKNHFRLLDAFKLVIISNPELKLVLTGSDKGTLSRVLEYADQIEILQNVKYLGFVSRDLYWKILEDSEGLIFPSLLGPTNLPPLEAALIGKRMAISNFHKQELKEIQSQAFYFDPHSIEDIKGAILKLLKGRDFDPIEFPVEQASKDLLSAIKRVLKKL